jgi:uncharacterized membrane protein
MQDWIKHVTEWVAVAVEAAAVMVVALAVIEAVTGFLRAFFASGGATDQVKDEVRLRLARWLVLALEFALAADILRTAIAPGWEEIGKLAAIAALRTVLNFFLQREMEQARRAA